ncbi:MAG: trypsin-like peptidase domain-containing protein [Candidatus Cloacimonetes bacterium]|nr:trypsin-like peptidase domain-containing protein [Candidatus Cloacimonadota bacterium]
MKLILFIFLVSTSSFASISFKDNTIADIVERVGPCVVNIVAKSRGLNQINPYDRGIYELFFGKPNNIVPKTQGEGSGFIYSSSGLILTNQHVIQDADILEVTLFDGRKYQARYVGGEPKKDIAIIKIDDKKFSGTFPKDLVCDFGDSTKLRVGEWAIAIGSPFSLDRTVTVGIISAKGRSLSISDDVSYDNLIQTDASINPGNSGGPLLNVHGKVIGINTAINALGQGLSFAIPIDLVKRITSDIEAFGRVRQSLLGVALEPLTDKHVKKYGLSSNRGVMIAKVFDKTPAKKYGLKPKDVILNINGTPIENLAILKEKLQEIPVGEIAKITLFRNFKKRFLPVRLEEYSEDAFVIDKKQDFNARTLTSNDKIQLRLDPSLQGVLVLQRSRELGLYRGDIIIQMNKEKISSLSKLKLELSHLRKGEPFLLILIREGLLTYIESIK